MTTKKQVKANKANSKKSTGAKTEQGKQVVALNAVKHGLFCSSLVMPNESANEYHELLDSLIGSVEPNGAIEQLLVEKIAVAMWRQLRLAKAEAASIEINKSIHQHKVRSQVSSLTSDAYDVLNSADVQPASAARLIELESCKKMITEFNALSQNDFDNAEELVDAPELMKQLEAEASEDQCETVDEYLEELSGGLFNWVTETIEWCEGELIKEDKRGEVMEALKIVQAKESAPISNQLLIRYQIALDNELYKAISVLRKQQEWRLKSGGIIEAEAV